MRAEAFDALRAIAGKSRGRLASKAVVEAAKDRSSPLHGYFTWNVKEAAQKRWEDEARVLIRSFEIEIITHNVVVKAPAFVRDPSAGQEQGYIQTINLRTDQDTAREVVVAEFARASAALARAQAVAAAVNLENEITDLRDRVDRLMKSAQTQGAGATA